MEESTAIQQENTIYGSFIERLIAYIIDGVVLGLMQGFIISPILALLGFNIAFFSNPSEEEVVGFIAAILGAGFIIYVVFFVMGWLYFAGLQSGTKQATVGKMVMGLIVTDVDGARLSFARASVRYFCKYLSSAIMMIGYLMAAFTEKRQALHDIIANSLVVKK